jgi:uncharacterized protein YuzE/DNA-binding XRE family transcriptional regulator
MKYFYDRESDSLYLTIAERRKYEDSVEAAPGVILDFDEAGRLIGIDLEHASKVVDVGGLELQREPTRAEADSVKLDGVRLKKEREALGMTQAQLGRELSVNANTIARWERGELKIEHAGMLQLALRALHNGASSPKPRQRLAGHVVRVSKNRPVKKSSLTKRTLRPKAPKR